MDGEWWWMLGQENSEAVTYTNWYKGEPNSPGTEKCLNVFPKYNYKWADGTCHLKACFVCE